MLYNPKCQKPFRTICILRKSNGDFKLVHMKKSSLWQEILVVKVFAVLATPQNWLWSRIRCFWQGLLFGSTHLHDKIYVKTFHKMKKKTQCNFPTFIFVSKIYELGRIAHDNSLPFCAKKGLFYLLRNRWFTTRTKQIDFWVLLQIRDWTIRNHPRWRHQPYQHHQCHCFGWWSLQLHCC